jgi:imidazolonepropionase-like amidohydrolase
MGEIHSLASRVCPSAYRQGLDKDANIVRPSSTPVPTASPTPSIPTLPGGALVVRNGTVIDGTGAGPILNGLVAIQDGEIIAIGPETQFQIPQEAQVVDAQGGTILPGFIDAHTHIFESAGTTQAVLNRWLRAGVTTVRDLGSRYGKDAPSLSIAAFKQQLAAYGNTIPTIVIAGPIMTAPGGYPVPMLGRGSALEVANAEEARQEAERLLADGADEIKIAVESGGPQQPFPALTLEQVKAITEVAHRQGTRVSAHVMHPQDAQVAIDGGVDDLAHKVLFGEMPDELIQQMVERNVWLVPTLVVEDDLAADVGLTDEQMKEFVEIMQDGLRRYLAAGGKVAMGSDFGATERIPQGMPLPELQRMVEFGMTPMQVIMAATSHAAQVCNLGDRLGTLEVGKQGDVIVVRDNPLEEIEAMGEV